MKSIIHLGHDLSFSHSPTLPSSVLIALRDLRRDLRLTLTEAHSGGVMRLELNPSLPGETFSIRVQAGEILLEGGDALGLIYGIYAVSEEWLGIPPMWYWMDFQAELRACVEIPDGTRLDGHSPKFKYRGWFINDEDLLSHWAADRVSGISHEAYQMIFEALLRSRGNMIVPATSVFADEPCWKWAAGRGLMLGEHHMDNLGLNPFRWPSHVPYNYLTHPQYLEHAWKRSVRAKASHGTKVIWTLGHRGKADRALWHEIPELKDNPARQGQVLGDVMRRQVEIIREVDPEPECVLNTWMEVSELMEQGHLTLPDHVRAVRADFHGGTATVIEPGMPCKGDGIYYHVAMHGQEKAHLTEWIALRRIQEEFLRYQRIGATHYVLINVSNVRPFFISASLATRWLYDGIDEANPDSAIVRFFEHDMGLPFAEALAWHESLTLASRAFGRQPGCFVGDEGPITLICMVLEAILVPKKYTLLQVMDRLRGFLLPHSHLTTDGFRDGGELLQTIDATVANYEPVVQAAEDLTSQVAARFRATCEYGVLFQSRYLYTLWQLARKTVAAKIAQESGDIATTLQLLEEALVLADRQHELLHEASQGKWRGFYECGVISPTRLPSSRIRWALEVLRGHAHIPEDHSCHREAYDIFSECKSYQGNRREKTA
jgi:hypothetical protein